MDMAGRSWSSAAVRLAAAPLLFTLEVPQPPLLGDVGGSRYGETAYGGSRYGAGSYGGYHYGGASYDDRYGGGAHYGYRY